MDSIEEQRIAQYGRGWMDAMCGRPPQSNALSYSLGYLDAKR
ncbi:hypothetical protein KY49_690 [Burkholderia sp. MSHR3999]|nr:hypothetical protein KY49_690 [Burkholderia sp. MSHR3999]